MGSPKMTKFPQTVKFLTKHMKNGQNWLNNYITFTYWYCQLLLCTGKIKRGGWLWPLCRKGLLPAWVEAPPVAELFQYGLADESCWNLTTVTSSVNIISPRFCSFTPKWGRSWFTRTLSNSRKDCMASPRIWPKQDCTAGNSLRFG